jgi:cleavage and polyadenylation specificity factor subunit 1
LADLVQGTIRTRQLPSKYRYGDSGWAARKIRLEEEVSHVCYYEKKGLYAVATNMKMPFKLPEDDNHKEWLLEGM